MQKRRELVTEVIKLKKAENAERSVRIYQVFKLIRRELVEYLKTDMGDKRLRGAIKKLIKENFCDVRYLELNIVKIVGQRADYQEH